MLLAAFVLLLIDFVISLSVRGLLRFTTAVAICMAFTVSAHAAPSDEKLAIELSSKPYLAYVVTGDHDIDHVSELGLRGLAMALKDRTSLNDIGVARLDPNSDDLSFYPLIYWPITTTEQPLSTEGAHRVTYYLQHGGMILFDAAQDEAIAPGFMHIVMAGVSLPTLVKLPDQHVLKRSFYLLKDFPGRFADRDFWVEPEESSIYDGVASVLFGSNGWAYAWAADDTGAPLYPCTPGGEPQREHAIRFGVNLALYALTGTYKTDQMNTAKLLQKMGAMSDHLRILFAPLLPWSWIIALAVLAALVILFALMRRARGVWWRGAFFAVLLAVLTNPMLVGEKREAIRDVAILAIDQSASTKLGDRTAQIEHAVENLQQKLGALPDLDVETVSVSGEDETDLFKAIEAKAKDGGLHTTRWHHRAHRR